MSAKDLANGTSHKLIGVEQRRFLTLKASSKQPDYTNDSNRAPLRKIFSEKFNARNAKGYPATDEKEDYEEFLPLTRSAETWQYFNKNLVDENELRQWVDEAVEERTEEKRVPFTIIDKDTKMVAGSTSFGNISFFDKRIEIGWSWLGPTYIGMGVNKQVKFALLCYAFDVMKLERVEIKTDVLNERSKAALLKVGMIPEGVLRSHMQAHSGRRRTTIYFSIIREEWQERKQSFFPELV